MKTKTGDKMPKDASPLIPKTPSSSIHTSMIAPGVLGVKIIGRLDSMSTGNIWRETNMELDRTLPKGVIVDASEIEYCDGSGIGYLFGLRQRQKKSGGDIEIRGLQEEFQQLLDLFDPSEFEESQDIQPGPISFFEKKNQLAKSVKKLMLWLNLWEKPEWRWSRRCSTQSRCVGKMHF